jgi:hypothetical protein
MSRERASDTTARTAPRLETQAGSPCHVIFSHELSARDVGRAVIRRKTAASRGSQGEATIGESDGGGAILSAGEGPGGLFAGTEVAIAVGGETERFHEGMRLD